MKGRIALVCSLVTTGALMALAMPTVADEPQASGSPCHDMSGCGDSGDGGGDSSSDGAQIEVRVWGSYSSPGEDGSDGSLETVTVSVPAICWSRAFMTGKEYYDWVQSGEPQQAWNEMGEPGPFEPFPDYEEHKDDDEGQWYTGRCREKHYEGDDFGDYATQWLEDNPATFYEADEEPPTPDIPPETLMDAAYDSMDLPEADYAWNPQRDGDGASFVNMDTWVWVDDGPVEVEIHAEAGGNQATVAAEVDTITYSAPTADTVECSGFSAQDSDECSLVFERASAHLPGQVTPVTAETAWSIDWSYNGEPQGELDPQTTSQTFDIPVAEIQTTVTD